MTFLNLASVQKQLLDNHGRVINYLRLAVTDRCNLRCTYCMPAQGLNWLPRKDLLSYDELIRICSLLINSGIDKIRITGGEPFMRRDIMQFLTALSEMKGLEQISITTNGVLTEPFIPDLKKLGIRSVNLSLDTLDRDRFKDITRRDDLPAVMCTLDRLLANDMEVKLNVVVMDGRNTQDILPLAALTKDTAISVRFIEEMPFNGDGHQYSGIKWNYLHILDVLRQQYPDIEKLRDPAHSTSYNYRIPGHKGTIGLIAAYTRSFCGSCNRIRITPQGMLKTCLYDSGVLDMRKILRETNDDTQLQESFLLALANRSENGWEAEKARSHSITLHESMASIGG